MRLKRLFKAFAVVVALSGCKLASSPVVKQFPPPDIDLCSMGLDKSEVFIVCEPWFYEGRDGYEQPLQKAAKMKYFLIAPNHYRSLQKYLEKLEVELGTMK